MTTLLCSSVVPGLGSIGDAGFSVLDSNRPGHGRGQLHYGMPKRLLVIGLYYGERPRTDSCDPGATSSLVLCITGCGHGKVN